MSTHFVWVDRFMKNHCYATACFRKTEMRPQSTIHAHMAKLRVAGYEV